MGFLFNELSVHGQFTDLSAFRTAVGRVMDIRAAVQRFGRELYCHRNLAGNQVTPDAAMQQAIRPTRTAGSR